MQIWIVDPTIEPLDEEQFDRMDEQFGTTSIPLHAIVAPDGRILARLTYKPTLTEEQYLAFLKKGLDALGR